MTPSERLLASIEAAREYRKDPDSYGDLQGICCAHEYISDAYLLEHLPDDNELADAAWCKTLGGFNRPEYCGIFHSDDHQIVMDCMAGILWFHSHYVCTVATRGDVRGIFRGFKINIKEGAK